jgi:hypothetical protein
MPNDDQPDYQEFADTQRLAEQLAAGNLELTYDNSPAAAAEAAALLPPPGTPVTVVRTTRILYHEDEQLVKLAEQRGISVSKLIGHLVSDGLAALNGAAPDPVTELRRGLDVAQRAAAALAADRHRDAA